ncbi:endonuclease domain-containing protein [Methylocystis sp. JAN1]|uniref:endonuclease domain-containing protein n=1 Tax=Methylocystis sp. JAN1 TaxID=3397211 RepID=UPI003FA26BE8
MPFAAIASSACVARRPCGPFVADFLCHAARLVIEVDGATHSTDELRRGSRRDAWFADDGFSVLRVTNAEVYAEFEGVLDTIRQRAPWRIYPPTLPRSAGEGAVPRLHRRCRSRASSPREAGRDREGPYEVKQ